MLLLTDDQIFPEDSARLMVVTEVWWRFRSSRMCSVYSVHHVGKMYNQKTL